MGSSVTHCSVFISDADLLSAMDFGLQSNWGSRSLGGLLYSQVLGDTEGGLMSMRPGQKVSIILSPPLSQSETRLPENLRRLAEIRG